MSICPYLSFGFASIGGLILGGPVIWWFPHQAIRRQLRSHRSRKRKKEWNKSALKPWRKGSAAPHGHGWLLDVLMNEMGQVWHSISQMLQVSNETCLTMFGTQWSKTRLPTRLCSCVSIEWFYDAKDQQTTWRHSLIYVSFMCLIYVSFLQD